LLFEAVSDVLSRLAAISPLVVLLDDVQWAEPTALQLLRHLGRALVNVPVLLVLSARCPPTVSAPNGHGMILIERCVTCIGDATYRVI
jgi:predicted ATPase